MKVAPRSAPALVVTQLGAVQIEDLPTRAPGEGEMLVEVLFSGVSIGTEMLAAHGRFDAFGPTPFVAGYQAVGRVITCGAGTEATFGAGDYVAVFQKGSHRQYLTVTAELSHKISDRALRECSLFVQPCVGANALNQAGVQAGDTVLVIGQGLIGQMTAMQAQLRGAYVVGTDVSQERLALAEGLCIDVGLNSAEVDLETAVKELFPEGVDVVIESTGITGLIDEGMKCVRNRGKFVFEGYYAGNLSMAYAEPHKKQITGIFPWFIGPAEVRNSVLRSIEGGRIAVEELITHVVSWRDVAALYQDLIDSKAGEVNGLVIDWQS